MLYYSLVIITFIISVIAYIICNIYEDRLRADMESEYQRENYNDLYKINLEAGLMRADIYSGIFNR